MGFVKFNICGPCCNYEFICHPYTVVDITDPRDNVSDTPTESDLYSNLLISNINSNPNCEVLISMYPSGGNLEVPGLYPSSIIPCKIPSDLFFGIDHTVGNFIESYENGSIVDLNTLLKKVTSNSKQKFDVPRDTGASAIQCGPLFGTGPIQTGCPCYEVSGNRSSAWGMINYQVYPHEFYQGCSSGQYNFGNPIYANCSQTFDVCSSDICNGSGVDQHKSIKLPYCLTSITADFPYYLENASINGGRGVPSTPILYDSFYGICNTGTPYYAQKTSIFATCYSATGNTYKWYYKPNLYRSGCGDLYLSAAYTTSAMVKWSPILISADPPAGLCNDQTRYIMFDCQSLSINTCGTINFTPTIISDKIGYGVPFYQCSVADSCPSCLPLGYYTFAKKPLSAQVTYSLPGAAGYEYSGDLYLDNVPWEGSAGIAAGCGVWVPNPFTQPCSNTGYDVSFEAFVAATVVSITYKGYQPSTYCFRGVGCNNIATCYQNEWNYALVYAISVDMGFGCTPSLHPVVKLSNPSRYYPTDVQNTQSECCDKATGNPNGTIVANVNDCDPLPSPDYAYRAASPGTMWNTKSCCELRVAWIAFPAGMTWAQYCNAAGKPECIYDEMPATKSPESYSLVNDICNDVVDCSVYDADGNLIYTVTI